MWNTEFRKMWFLRVAHENVGDEKEIFFHYFQNLVGENGMG